MENDKPTVKQQDRDYIVISRSLMTTIGIGLLTFVIGGIAGYFIALTSFNRGLNEAVAELAGSLNTEGGQPAAQLQPTQPPARLENVSVDDDPFIGPEDAPVVIVEFSDFR